MLRSYDMEQGRKYFDKWNMTSYLLCNWFGEWPKFSEKQTRNDFVFLQLLPLYIFFLSCVSCPIASSWEDHIIFLVFGAGRGSC